MGPPPLALGLVLKKEVYWRLAPEAMVRQDGIVSQQPVGQLSVKGSEVIKQQILVVVHEGLLEGASEPFDMRVQSGGARGRAAHTRAATGFAVWPDRGWGRWCAAAGSRGSGPGATSSAGDGAGRWSERPRPADRPWPGGSPVSRDRACAGSPHRPHRSPRGRHEHKTAEE